MNRDFYKTFYIYLFLDRKEGREKERERNINVWLPLASPLLGTWPATQACALAWESNQRPFDLQASTQLLSHTSQGGSLVFLLPGIFFPFQDYHPSPALPGANDS